MTEAQQARQVGKATSLQFISLAYVAALAVAALVVWYLGVERPLLTLLVADLAATLAIFRFSTAWGNGSVYDPYWSVVPPFLVLYWAALAEPGTVALRQVLVAVCVFAWGIRLTGNWVRSFPGLHHEDWRYLDLYARSKMPKWATSLLGIHIFPTVQVFLGCLPLVPALAVGTRPFGVLDIVATTVTVGAIVIETVADEQLHAFARAKRGGEILDRGLWAYSRHPNYFGELSFWTGLFLFGLAADPGYWWALIGPLAMLAMFVFASIPLLDARSIERRPGYDEHMRRVSRLVPWFRR